MSNLKENFRKMLLENENNVWYHGTPDVRGIEQEGFKSLTYSVEYIDDPEGYKDAQRGMEIARQKQDEDTYHDILSSIPNFKGRITMKKPTFLTNVLSVAKTYADPQRSFDYQNAKEKILKVTVQSGKLLTINAYGERFRFIPTDIVRNSFIKSGVSEEKFNEILFMFQWYRNDKGIKTDVIAVIAQKLGFDMVDVKGVLDSYNGGTTKSTVRMVFDASKITILK